MDNTRESNELYIRTINRVYPPVWSTIEIDQCFCVLLLVPSCLQPRSLFAYPLIQRRKLERGNWFRNCNWFWYYEFETLLCSLCVKRKANDFGHFCLVTTRWGIKVSLKGPLKRIRIAFLASISIMHHLERDINFIIHGKTKFCRLGNR